MSDSLVQAALAARDRAHAPYSCFLVGCAVESADGRIAVGANVENACYRLGTCAEQSALAAAQVAFGLDNVVRLAVVGGAKEASDDALGEVVLPCGACRQAIMEATSLSGRDIEVICCDHAGAKRESYRISELLPAPFTLKPE